MRLLIYIFCFLPSLLVYSQNPTIEKITLYGNNRTKDHTILRELILQEGKTFSSDLLQKDRAWLLRQGFLKRIEFLTKVGSTKDQRILIMVVQEKGTWSVSPILSNNDLFGWYSVFTQFNIYHLSFRYLYGDFFPHFDETDTGIKFALGKGIGRKWKIGIRCGMEQIWVGDPSVTFSGTHKDNISLLETFAVLDTRDWPVYPKSGIYIHSWAQRFNPFGNNRFHRTGIDFRLYSQIVNDNILAIQVYGQFSHGNIPVYKRIHMGGSKTIRGYSTGSLSGEHGILMSLEYRFPILYVRNPLAGIHVGYAGVLFIDSGATWFQDQETSLDMIHIAAGLGIHLIWDHWVLRVEYGNHGTGWGFINAGTGIKF